MTLYDLDDGELFQWKDDIYKLTSIDNANKATVRRVAMIMKAGIFLVNSHEENFNSYAEIIPGELTCHWTVKEKVL